MGISKSEKLFYKVLKTIRDDTKDMSDDEVYKFHEMLKDWTNKAI